MQYFAPGCHPADGKTVSIYNMETARLLLQPLDAGDAAFIFELLNTKGWIQFIGNRNINSLEDASAYIQKVQDNESLTYWTVKQKSDNSSAGLITLIKRDYLEHPDIGFAFLPQYCGNGYAFEAAQEVLRQTAQNSFYTYITAITIPGNISSIRLLEKLGLRFEREIAVENEILHVYTVPAHKLLTNQLPKIN
jgi:RimJ/RimL family protein N-acetyltransferase